MPQVSHIFIELSVNARNASSERVRDELCLETVINKLPSTPTPLHHLLLNSSTRVPSS